MTTDAILAIYRVRVDNALTFTETNYRTSVSDPADVNPMKRSSVPQDIGPKDIEEIAYAVDEGGRYVKVPSIGWAPKNVANEQAWEVIEGEIEAQLHLIRSGKRSPLAYHMTRNLMTVGLLASYMALPRWRVKRHLKG